MKNTNKIIILFLGAILFSSILYLSFVKEDFADNKKIYSSLTNANADATATKANYDATDISYTNLDLSFSKVTLYDTNNYDLQYHDPVDVIMENEWDNNKGIWVKNSQGKMDFLPWTDISSYTTYNPPGSFVFGPKNYVPSYEDTVIVKYFTDSTKK